jgi:hypothetical protein
MRLGSARLCMVAVASLLAFGGCGGDDEEPASGATGAQGASGVEGTDVTAEEFLVKLLPEKELAIEGVVATEPECEGLKVAPSLVLVISDAASKADPQTPLTDLVVEEC